MAKCDICGKQQISGNKISHSHKKTRHKWNPNIRKVKVVLDGVAKSLKICSRCLRSNKKTV